MKAAGLLIVLTVIVKLVAAQDRNPIEMKIAKTPPIPPAAGTIKQFGLAGAVSGVSHNCLLIAGGANFEDNLPWRGGTKSYHDEVYILTQKKGIYSWKQPALKFPQAIAYSACVTVPKGIVSIGGENANGPLADVWLIRSYRGKPSFKKLVPLPEALSSAGAALAGNKVYVAGGLNPKGAVASFYSLDLNHTKNGWQKLPDLPVVLSHAVVAAQFNGFQQCIYVIGGRYRDGEVTTFLHTVLKYDPSKNTWENAGEISLNGETFGLSAGTGVAYDASYIVLFGGDKGIIFNQTERINNKLATLPNGPEKQSLLAEKDKLLSDHPGLFRKILIYNTITKQFTEAGEIPGKVPVTTSAFLWNEKAYIPSGEIQPGVRTDQVLEITFEN